MVDPLRLSVARLLPMDISGIDRLEQSVEDALPVIGGLALMDMDKNSPASTGLQNPNFDAISKDMTSSCLDFLNHPIPNLEMVFLQNLAWQCTAHFLDLALILYVGVHPEDVG